MRLLLFPIKLAVTVTAALMIVGLGAVLLPLLGRPIRDGLVTNPEIDHDDPGKGVDLTHEDLLS